MNEDYISLKEAAEILGKSVPATRATIKRHGIQTISVNGKHGIELRVHVHGLETLRDNARTAAKSTGGTSDTSKGSKTPRKGAQTENSENNSVNPWEDLAQARAKIEELEAKLERKESIIEDKDAQLKAKDARLEEKEERLYEVIAALSARSAANPQPKAIEAAKPKPWWQRRLKRD
jgi:septal ring factor EnvC (AmiA/AmiB activator)